MGVAQLNGGGGGGGGVVDRGNVTAKKIEAHTPSWQT